MIESADQLPFRLSTGGLFYQLLLRLRLVEENRYRPWRRITLASGITWLPLLVLTALSGTLYGGSVEINFLPDPLPHGRFLIALPLLVLADLIIDPYMTAIVGYFHTSGLVPNDAKPLYRKSLEKLIRQRALPGPT